jgi:glycosyltransferase involved in cell wall biosynthesis
MKELPFVSVIIPSLNEEKYIENCLKALRVQDYKGSFEIIVVDGGSRDKTVEIAKKYADKVIVINRKGVSAGRNAGAREARGEILLFIDADTVAAFNLITELVKGFKKGVVGTTCQALPLSSNISEFMIYWFYNQFMKASLQTKKPQVAGFCCAYKKEVFKKVGGFDEKLYSYEDFDFSERASKFGRISCVGSTFVMTSPRRIRKWGKTKAAMKYLKSYITYLLTGKGFKGREYPPIR